MSPRCSSPRSAERPPVGFLRLATLVLAQALDLVTFSVMVGRHGLVAEANPLVSDLFGSYGMPAVVRRSSSRSSSWSGRCASPRPRAGGRGVWAVIGGVPLALAIAAGLIGGITNAASYLG